MLCSLLSYVCFTCSYTQSDLTVYKEWLQIFQACAFLVLSFKWFTKVWPNCPIPCLYFFPCHTSVLWCCLVPRSTVLFYHNWQKWWPTCKNKVQFVIHKSKYLKRKSTWCWAFFFISTPWFDIPFQLASKILLSLWHFQSHCCRHTSEQRQTVKPVHMPHLTTSTHLPSSPGVVLWRFDRLEYIPLGNKQFCAHV